MMSTRMPRLAWWHLKQGDIADLSQVMPDQWVTWKTRSATTRNKKGRATDTETTPYTERPWVNAVVVRVMASRVDLGWVGYMPPTDQLKITTTSVGSRAKHWATSKKFKLQEIETNHDRLCACGIRYLQKSLPLISVTANFESYCLNFTFPTLGHLCNIGLNLNKFSCHAFKKSQPKTWNSICSTIWLFFWFCIACTHCLVLVLVSSSVPHLWQHQTTVLKFNDCFHFHNSGKQCRILTKFCIDNVTPSCKQITEFLLL